MTKRLVQHGNSAALVLEKPLLQLLNIDLTTDLEIITDGKNLIISPAGSQSSEGDLLASLEKINKLHGPTLEKLAK
jgi:antitoxin component of MazEF toxin-antitoxin module